MELPDKDVKFIADETLDFALDGQEEDISVICPVELNIRCSAQTSDRDILPGERRGRSKEQALHWSPLSPEKLEEVMKEANRLATQLEKCKLLEKGDASSEGMPETVSELEPLPLISILQAEKGITQKSRRKTFNVKNSPLQALLPRVESETCSVQESPNTPFSGSGSHASCDTDPPICKRLQSKSSSGSSGSQISKKSRPNQSFRTLTAMKSPAAKKPVGRSSQKSGPPPPSLQRVSQDQKSPLGSIPQPRTNRQRCLRKTEDASCKDHSIGAPQRSIQSSSRSPKPSSTGTNPGKKSSAAPEKGIPIQRTYATTGQCESVGGNGPQRRTNSRIQSQLPVAKNFLKATGHNTSLGKHVVPENSNQQKLSVRMPGGKGTAVPGPAGKKASVYQQIVSSGPSQNNRLRLPRKATTENSRSALCSIRR